MKQMSAKRKTVWQILIITLCFSESNISTVLTCKKDDVDKALDEVQDKISGAGKSCPSSLILYYSGHGTIYGGQYFLKLGSKPEDWLEASWMQEKLKSIEPKHLLVILDCCYSGGFQILPPLSTMSTDQQFTLWASSMPLQTSRMSLREGSRFTKYLVSALRSGSQCYLETRGIDSCNICKQFIRSCKQRDFLTVKVLQDYVSDHVHLESMISQSEQQPYSATICRNDTEVPLAYAYDQPLAFTVWFMINGNIEQPLIIEDPNKDIAFNRDLLYIQYKGEQRYFLQILCWNTLVF